MDNNQIAQIIESLEIKLYKQESSWPKPDAQINLKGRTHYVEDDTLRFHHSRILRRGAICSGLFFYVIESCALDFNNTRRGFRGVVFDVWGNLVSRPSLESCASSSDKAAKLMWQSINEIDVKAYYEKRLDEKANESAFKVQKINAAIEKLNLSEAA